MTGTDRQPKKATDSAALVLRAAGDLRRRGEAPEDPHSWRDAAIVLATARAWAGEDHAGIRALAGDYAGLLLKVPSPGAGGTVQLVPAGTGERRRRGSFATPPQLAAVLADHALPEGTALPDGQWASPARIPTVVDPACGSGALLRAALVRLLALGCPPALAAPALHGVDDDPAAIAVCRAALAAEVTAAGHPCAPEDFAGRLVVGDALLGPGEHGLDWAGAFPAVLGRVDAQREEVTGWRGGFDVVLANPPWERLKVHGRDWAGAPPARLREARALAARRLREAGRHPLTGAGELNAYLPFVETCWRLLAPGGRAGLLVPAGITADRSASRLWQALLADGALERLHLLDPPRPLFRGVSQRVGVAVLVLRGRADATGRDRGPAQVAVGLRDPREPVDGRAWSLEPDLPRLVNPNTGTLPLFGSATDARIVTAVHRRWPVLHGRDPHGARLLDDPWQLRLITPLHMTRDSRWFSGAPGPGLLPLWEAKHAGLLDHRGGGSRAHRYWVPARLVEERFGDLAARGWLAGYRNVTTTDSPRTLIPCALPVAGVGNSLPLLSAPRLPLLLAALASLPVDHLVRQKHAGANLNFFKLEQVPLPPPEAYDVPAPWEPGTTLAAWILTRLARAVAWDDDLAGLGEELTAGGVPVPHRFDGERDGERRLPPAPDAIPWAVSADRAPALAELDAAHAILLGLDREDLVHVLGTFPALRTRELRRLGEFRTARLALEAYDRLR
ncbi:MAG: hypothetical protein QG608_880 [Actinomycetota bacterium]|nr:hypothetical protein [Actinomycetota bacterium]